MKVKESYRRLEPQKTFSLARAHNLEHEHEVAVRVAWATVHLAPCVRRGAVVEGVARPQQAAHNCDAREAVERQRPRAAHVLCEADKLARLLARCDGL